MYSVDVAVPLEAVDDQTEPLLAGSDQVGIARRLPDMAEQPGVHQIRVRVPLSDARVGLAVHATHERVVDALEHVAGQLRAVVDDGQGKNAADELAPVGVVVDPLDGVGTRWVVLLRGDGKRAAPRPVGGRVLECEHVADRRDGAFRVAVRQVEERGERRFANCVQVQCRDVDTRHDATREPLHPARGIPEFLVDRAQRVDRRHSASQLRPTMLPSASMSMRCRAGDAPRPGIVLIAPQIG